MNVRQFNWYFWECNQMNSDLKLYKSNKWKCFDFVLLNFISLLKLPIVVFSFVFTIGISNAKKESDLKIINRKANIK